MTKTFFRRPSTIAYMMRGCLPSPPLSKPPSFPPLKLVWKNATVLPDEMVTLGRLTGLTDARALSLLFPHVIGFRLLMALLTDRAFPLPIWKALQIRNQIRQHSRIDAGDRLEIETCVAGQRVLEKGVEVDLHTCVRSHDRPVWESLVTFYYRGKYGEPGSPSTGATPPVFDGEEIARWRAAGGSGWRFGRLTGDFNGIHLSSSYARVFGFRRAFHHPQRVLGQCLAHLSAIGAATADHSLDVWLRGQVYYDSMVALRAANKSDGVVFGLYPEEQTRPAIIARWRPEATPSLDGAERDGCSGYRGNH